MNRMKLESIAVALMALSTSALAGTSEGPYAGVGIGEYSANLNINVPGSVSFTLGSSSPKISGGLFGGYNWNFGAGSVAAELSYNSNVGSPSDFTAGPISTKFDNNWQISALPGYNFSKDTEGYVRLGWTRATGHASGLITGDQTFNGVVFGLGVDQAVAPNMAVRLEWQYLKLNTYSNFGVDFKPSSTGVDLSLRYAF